MAFTKAGKIPERLDQRWEFAVVILIGAYFFLRTLFFAINIAPDLPPDEHTHAGLVSLYSAAPLLIDNTPQSYQFGLVTNTPYLYYLTVGKIAQLFNLSSYVSFRIVNVGFALLFFIICYLLSRQVTQNSWVRVLFLVMVTNTLMLSFLWGSVNYDNLANLLALVSLYALVKYDKTRCSSYLLVFFISLGLGNLAKGSFLMLSPLLFLIWLGMRFRTLKDDWRVFWLDLKQRKPLVLAMLVILSATTIANFMLYGLNYIQYKNVVPGCNQVLNNELCMKNRIHARNWVVTEYKNGSMSFMDAYKATDQIWHSGDRDHARRLLYNARQVKMQPPPVMDVVDYMGLVWKQAVMPTVFGVQAHRSMLRASSELLVYAAILAIALVCFIRFLRFDGQDRIWITFAAVSVGYYLFLVGYYNYTSYLSSHAPLLGVQGRYLFLIIVPVYLLSAEFLLRHAPRWLQVILVVLVGSVFIYGDFPYYLANTNDAWYGTS